MLQTRDRRGSLTVSLLGWSSTRCVIKESLSLSGRGSHASGQVLCGHVPYDGWDRDRIGEAILKGIRPYRPKGATHLGLVDELWDILQRCWDERREARPDLRVIRTCLDEITPMWHARKHLPLISADDATSLYSPSHYTTSSSPPIPSPAPSPAPPSPSPSPAPSSPAHSSTLALNRHHNYPQRSTAHYAPLSLRPSQSQPQFYQGQASSSRNPR